jgi:uncharacterized protein (TIGR03435 family)
MIVLRDVFSNKRRRLLILAGLSFVTTLVAFGRARPDHDQTKSSAQSAPPTSPAFEYDVVLIKPTNPGGNGNSRVIQSPGEFITENITLLSLIKMAYGGSTTEISGAPSWVNSERFDVDAKAEKPVADELAKLSPDQFTLVRQHMLQTVLADRFKLSAHRETRDLPIYSLVVAKNGSKLHDADASKGHGGIRDTAGPGGARTLTFQNVDLSSLVGQLTQRLGRTVVDKTGLTGRYDFTLTWVPDPAQGSIGNGADDSRQPAARSIAPETSGPSILTAVQEQLGLKLESGKGPVEIIVIDRVERPSGN